MTFIQEGQLVWPKRESTREIRSMRVITIKDDKATCQIIYLDGRVSYEDYPLSSLTPAGDG